MSDGTIRVLHTADLHITLTRYGTATGSGVSSRVVDFLATLDRFVDEAIDRKVHVAVFAGDTLHTRHEGPWVRAAVAKAIHRLTVSGIRVIVLPGNHDGQTTVGDRDSHSLRWLEELHIPHVIVPLQPMRSWDIDVEGGGVFNLTAYPYPHKRGFDADLAHITDPDERVLEGGRLLERHIEDVARHLDALVSVGGPSSKVPRLFVGHLTVGGASVGSEQSMKFTWDVAITPNVLEAWDYAALGHIHKPQQVPGSTKAWYAGSPEVIDFSEADDRKGFLYVEMRRGEPPEVTVIPSGHRRAIRLQYTQTKDGLWALYPPPENHLGEVDWSKGPIVEARFYPVDQPDQVEQSRLERRLYEEGASFVKSVTVRPDAAPTERIEVTTDGSALDIAAVTEAHLVANHHPVEPTMTAARQLIAAVGGTQ